MASFDWYQTEAAVTATVPIKGIVEPITSKFEAQYCAILVGENVYWEARLTNSIIPERSSLRVGKVRAELKMTKADPVKWTDLMATGDTVASSPTSHPRKTTQSVPSPQPSSSPSPPSSSSSPHPPRAVNPKPFSKTVQNDFVYLNHLPHDWMNRGEGEVGVKVMVMKVAKDTCTVDFKERQFELLFQTSDERFLSSYTGSSQTMFVWKVQLFDGIKPEASQFQVSPTAITITLRKASPSKWKSLEQSQHHMTLSSTSANNNINSSSSSHDQKMTSSDESCDSNDLDAVDDVTADDVTVDDVTANDVTVNDVTKTLSSLQSCTNSSIAMAQAPDTKSHAGVFSTGRHGNEYVPTPSGENEHVHNFHVNPIYTKPSTSTDGGSAHKSSQRPPKATTRVIPSELESSDPSYRFEQLRRPSTTGLTNLGNTCFMNSILQCLSNTPDLRDYFVSGRYLANINSHNPLGFDGKLAKCFCVILRKLWSGEYEFFSPKKLLEIVAKRSQYFSGYSQHDTHEFMSYLIDGLHEDLNRVREKPVTEPVEMENHPDREVAAESWRVHRMRNDSTMVDLFQGQFKSTLVCQECNKESVTFDPFMSMSVPIPRNLRRLAVTFVPQDPYVTPKQLILQLPPEATLKLLKASVARHTSLSLAQLRVFEVFKGKFQSFMVDNRQPISGIKSSDIIIVSEVLSDKHSGGGGGGGTVVEINVVQRVQVAPFPTKCALCGCGSEEGRRLQRCGKCKAVGYCHRECQERDWAEHRLKCGKVKAFPTGLPFVISLPASQLTYSKLTEYAEKFASHSVTVTRRSPTQLPYSRQTSVGSSDSSIQESAGDILTSDGSMQGCTKNIQTSEANMEVCTDGIQTSTESIQECAEDIQEYPMYTLTRVDRYVEPMAGEMPLKDRGDVALEFDDSTIYLAMDWRNGPNEKDGVDVTPRPTMECEGEEREESAVSQSEDVSLTDCLQLFTEPETLSQEEAWYCPRCKQHRPAIKQMSVWRLPRFLIVHLKRFSFHNSVWRSKIDHLVAFPLNGLDMSPYLLGDAAKDISPETPPIYDLYATVNHYGNIYIGHYVAYVKPPPSEENRNSEWLCYDDHKVWSVKEDKITCNEAYVLFYRRRDTKHTASL